MDRYQKIAGLAQKISKCKEQLILVCALLTIKTFDSKAELIVSYNDGSDQAFYRLIRGALPALIEEKMNLVTPILGAVETSLREQIRKLEGQLRDLGCGE